MLRTSAPLIGALGAIETPMSFNVDELAKILRSTRGIFRRAAQSMISEALAHLAPEVLHTECIDDQDARRTLSRCLNHYTAKRNAALHRGATTYSNAEWASSAACESWLQSRLLDSELDAKAAEDLVVDLIERGRRPRISRAIAALLARDIAWAHLKGIAEISSYYLNENSEFEELLARPGNPSNCTAQDKALILFQARHFIKYHTASIREHIASMNAYREAADKGILLYFGSEIASYIGDAPYLKSLEK